MLGGIADTVAQTLTAIRRRNVRKLGGPQKDDFVAIEIHELGKKNLIPPSEVIPTLKHLQPPFDFERLTRFMAYGLLMAPVQFKWFQTLSRAFPLARGNGTVAALKRVACDQLVFAPVGGYSLSGMPGFG